MGADAFDLLYSSLIESDSSGGPLQSTRTPGQKRCGRLEEYLEAAQRQVERLAQEREHPDPGVTRRERAARERTARERLERVEQALAQMPAMEAAKAPGLTGVPSG